MRARWRNFGRVWTRNAFSFLVGMLLLAVTLEVGLRLAFRSSDPRTLVYTRKASPINGFGANAFPRRTPEGEIRILMLGASAFVTRDFQPQFERLLNESPRLRGLGKRVRVLSTGVPAHMSFDSLWKYQLWYEGYDFDLVVFYHGINDARANCYPEDVFRDDYSHMPYFRQYASVMGWMQRHPFLARSFVATWVHKLAVRASVQLSPRFQRQAPYNDPRNDPWLPEGADIKTETTFERNVESIVRIARERKQPLLLLTYAWYLPRDYTNERFKAKQLDYSFTEESVAAEVWGLSHNVARALEVHNAVVRRVAARHPDVWFHDMEREIPKDGEHFIDVCHWTDRGRNTFAHVVSSVLFEVVSNSNDRPQKR